MAFLIDAVLAVVAILVLDGLIASVYFLATDQEAVPDSPAFFAAVSALEVVVFGAYFATAWRRYRATVGDPAAVELGRRGGLIGGKARAEKLSPQERSEIARKAAQARWGKQA